MAWNDSKGENAISEGRRSPNSHGRLESMCHLDWSSRLLRWTWEKIEALISIRTHLVSSQNLLNLPKPRRCPKPDLSPSPSMHHHHHHSCPLPQNPDPNPPQPPPPLKLSSLALHPLLVRAGTASPHPHFKTPESRSHSQLHILSSHPHHPYLHLALRLSSWRNTDWNER